MYQAIQLNRLISALGALAILVFVVILWIKPDDSQFDWLKHTSTAVTVTGIIVLVLGNKRVFCPLWRWKPVEKIFFPYVAGEWQGQISSNWPVAKAMMSAFIEGGTPHPDSELDISALGTFDKPIKVTIDADLFRVRLKLQTTDDYSTSHTIVVTPQRTSSGVAQLLYLYCNDTPVPISTDTIQHLGAGCLDVLTKNGETVLEGTYWTARNWTKGLNTAGRILLRRPSN